MIELERGKGGKARRRERCRICIIQTVASDRAPGDRDYKPTMDDSAGACAPDRALLSH